MKLGDKIKKIRDFKGITQEEIAEKLNITPQAYSKLERNSTKMDFERLQEIANFLSVSVDEIQKLDDKNLFINLNTYEKNKGDFVVNKNTDSEFTHKLIQRLEVTIEDQKQEIQFLRAQITQLNNIIQTNTK